MKNIILFFGMFLLVIPLWSQETEPRSSAKDSTVVVQVVEVMPEYPGGEKARIKFIQQNLIYPLSARENDIQGTV